MIARRSYALEVFLVALVAVTFLVGMVVAWRAYAADHPGADLECFRRAGDLCCTKRAGDLCLVGGE